MKLYDLDKTPETPVSHEPGLNKKVLMPGAIGCLRHLSHITLKEGDKVAVHAHADATEVFYCTKGSVEFSVNGKPAVMKNGTCLVVEPGEAHAIVKVGEPTELIYTMVVP